MMWEAGKNEDMLGRESVSSFFRASQILAVREEGLVTKSMDPLWVGGRKERRHARRGKFSLCVSSLFHASQLVVREREA